MHQERTFALTIQSQDVVVHYQPHYFVTADYAHFEFLSPHTPRRRIPISETGYRSHFSPMHAIEAAVSVEAYARVLALALMAEKLGAHEGDDTDDGEQLDLF